MLILWLSLLLLWALFYTYAGYPIIAAILAGLRKPGPGGFSTRYEPTVTVCLAVHNSALHIRRKLESLMQQDYPPEKYDILVFSDGSEDGSDDIVRSLERGPVRIRLLQSELRVGKPTALNRLRKIADGEILVMTDARQPVSPNALRELVGPFADGRVGCVAGNLVMQGSQGSGFYWKYEKWIRVSESQLGWSAGVSGALYAVRKSDVPELPPDLILDDMWIPLQAQLVGHKKVLFSESACAYDEAFDDAGEFRRKVRTLAGNYQLFARMPRILLPFGNPAWFSVVSHKVLRLAGPWLFLGLWSVSAVGLFSAPKSTSVHRYFAFLFWGQLGFLVIALFGSRVGRWGAIARTFVVMNAAAVVGLWRFARGSQKVTW
ncbi:MAG: glycosyltransferase family 2 protein [Pseudomonadota bacterium]